MYNAVLAILLSCLASSAKRRWNELPTAARQRVVMRAIDFGLPVVLPALRPRNAAYVAVMMPR